TLDAASFDVTVSFGVECPAGDLAVVGSVHRAWLSRSGPVHTPFGDVPAGLRLAMPRHRALLWLERRYFRDPRLRSVLAASVATADEVVDVYGLRRDLVQVMPNGFDPDEFGPGARTTSRVEQRRRMGVDDDVVVLFVANELHRKGFDTLLDAAARVGDPRVRIELVGRADPSAYRDRIAQLHLTDRVHWNGPQLEVAPWYAGADLLVLPTRYEPFGNVVVEALACGLPVITSTAAGAAVAVQPEVNGLLQQHPEDAAELATLLATALEPGRLAGWSRAAPATVARFEWHVVARQLLATIERVAAERARAHWGRGR
ncbi:MAG TPA: glycosyltransferase family 4 protein, partial [Acidimicrobiales bacterium]|nr:glycosyltransferase family 4 protein [Acidimicrobiales bacterium]